MAIYRNVHVSFWQDVKVSDDMELYERYALLYLLTNPHTNVIGCYELSKSGMSRDTGLDREEIDRVFERLKDMGVAEYSDETREVLLYHWNRYNWSASPKLDTALADAIALVKSDGFRRYVAGIYNQRASVIENGKEICFGDGDNGSSGVGDDASDICAGVDYSRDKDARVRDKRQAQKHKHGEYRNVMLTDEELEKLKGEFPNDWRERIERLSEYVASKGAKYKSHYATIRAWSRKDSGKESGVKPMANGEGINDDALGEWI